MHIIIYIYNSYIENEAFSVTKQTLIETKEQKAPNVRWVTSTLSSHQHIDLPVLKPTETLPS